MYKKEKDGITLIALIITIIVMLILAGVAISAISSNTGLFEKSKEVVNQYGESSQNEFNSISALIPALEGYDPIVEGDINEPIQYKLNPEGATKATKVTLSTTTRGYKIEYKVENEDWNEYTSDGIIMYKNGTISTRLKRVKEVGNETIIKIQNIDTTSPSAPVITATWSAPNRVTIKVSTPSMDTVDEGGNNSLAGIQGYSFGIKYPNRRYILD